jgi:hypothetical protein
MNLRLVGLGAGFGGLELRNIRRLVRRGLSYRAGVFSFAMIAATTAAACSLALARNES